MSAIKRTEGSVIIATLIIALITAVLVGGFLSTVSQEIRNSHRSRMALQCVNLAEAGLEYAIDAIHRGDWTDWEVGPKGFYRDEFPFTEISWNHNMREVRVYAEPFAAQPRVVAEGIMRTVDGIDIRRQVLIELGTRSLFASGLVARNQVVFSGNNVFIDSYRSSNGLYHATLNANDNGSVASISVQSDALMLGNADVWGRVATGGSMPNVGPNGSIKGADTPKGVRIDPNRVAMDFYAELPPPVAPTLTAPNTSISGGAMGVAGTTTEYQLSGLKLSGNNVLTVSGDVVLVMTGDFSLSGNAQVVLTPGSTLTVYTQADFDATGNGILNHNQLPQTLQIYGVNPDNQSIKIAGNGGFFGVVYAPNANVAIVGNGQFFGALVGNNLHFTGNANFHYDEDLADFGDDGIKRVTRWVELTDAAKRKNMATILNDGF